MQKLWLQWMRWRKADRLGWMWFARIIGRTNHASAWKVEQAIRNANRLYRLTRFGNPWRWPHGHPLGRK